MEELTGIKGFLRKAVEKQGKTYDDNKANELIKAYNNDYDKLISDVALKSGFTPEEVEPFKQRAIQQFKIQPIQQQDTTIVQQPQEQTIDYGPFDPATVAKSPQAKQNFERYQQEQAATAIPSINRGMPIDDAKKVADNISKEIPLEKQEPGSMSGFGKELGQRAQRSGWSLNEMLANTPDFINRVAVEALNLPIRGVGKLAEVSGLVDTAENWRMVATDLKPDNVNEYINQQKTILTNEIAKINPKHNIGIVEAAQQGDWATFTRNLAGGVADSFAPSLAMMVSGGTLGVGGMIGSSTAVFGAGKYAEMEQQAPNMSEQSKVFAAATNGALEGIFETYLGSGAVGSAIKNVVAKEGRDAAVKIVDKGIRQGFIDLLIKHPALAPLGEGFEEMGTQIAQNYVDKVSGFKPDINIMDGVVDAGLIGSLSGAVHSAPLYAGKAIFGSDKVNPEGTTLTVDPAQAEEAKKIKRQEQIDQQISGIQDNEGNVTKVEIDGQTFYVKNSEDLGNPDATIFVRDAEGNTKPINAKKITNWNKQTPDEVKTDIANEDAFLEAEKLKQQEVIQKAAEQGIEIGSEIQNEFGTGIVTDINKDGVITAQDETGAISTSTIDETAPVIKPTEPEPGAINIDELSSEDAFIELSKTDPKSALQLLQDDIAEARKTAAELRKVPGKRSEKLERYKQADFIEAEADILENKYLKNEKSIQSTGKTEQAAGSSAKKGKTDTQKAQKQDKGTVLKMPNLVNNSENIPENLTESANNLKESINKVPETATNQADIQQTKDLVTTKSSQKVEQGVEGSEQKLSTTGIKTAQIVNQGTQVEFEVTGETGKEVLFVKKRSGKWELLLDKQPNGDYFQGQAYPPEETQKMVNKYIPKETQDLLDEWVSEMQKDGWAAKGSDFEKFYSDKFVPYFENINNNEKVQTNSVQEQQLQTEKRTNRGNKTSSKSQFVGMGYLEITPETTTEQIKSHYQEIGKKVDTQYKAIHEKLKKGKDVTEARKGYNEIHDYHNLLGDLLKHFDINFYTKYDNENLYGHLTEFYHEGNRFYDIQDKVLSGLGINLDKETSGKSGNTVAEQNPSEIKEAVSASENDDFDYAALFDGIENEPARDLAAEEEAALEKEYQESKYSKKWAATRKEAIDKLTKQYTDARAKKIEWQAKVYKKNGGTVEVGKDNDFDINNVSIDYINEKRKTNVIRGAETDMKEALEDLKALRVPKEQIDALVNIWKGQPKETITPEELNQKFKDKSVTTPEQKPVPTAAEIQQAEAEVNLNPTEAQKEAGNYKKGHAKVAGFDITIENPKGSERTGTDKTGKKWSVTLNNSYGYFKRSKGKDGDQIDVFLGENLNPEKVFVIDQNNEKGEFDESKVMLGFDSAEQAKESYLKNYSPGWKGLGQITEVGINDFKTWLNDGKRQNKPFGNYKDTPTPLTAAEIKKAEKAAKRKAAKPSPEEIKRRKEVKDKTIGIEPINLEQAILKYIVQGGRFNWAEIERELFPRARTEMNKRIWMLKGDAETIDNLRGILNGLPFEEQANDINVFRDAVLEVVRRYDQRHVMADRILQIGSENQQQDLNKEEAYFEAKAKEQELFEQAEEDALWQSIVDKNISLEELNNLFLQDYEQEETDNESGVQGTDNESGNSDGAIQIGDNQENAIPGGQSAGENPKGLNELFGEVETTEQKRLRILDEKLGKLTPTQRKEAERLIKDADNRIKTASNGVKEAQAALKKKQKEISEAQQQDSGENPLQAKRDFSPENITKILKPFRDAMSIKQREYFSELDKKGDIIDKAAKVAGAQQELVILETPEKDEVKKQAKNVEKGQPLDSTWEERMALREKAKNNLVIDDLFNSLPEKIQKSLLNRTSDFFYKGESWKNVIEKSAISPDMWVNTKDTQQIPDSGAIFDSKTVTDYYLVGADNQRNYSRKIPKEFYDYFNQIKSRYNQIIDNNGEPLPISKPKSTFLDDRLEEKKKEKEQVKETGTWSFVVPEELQAKKGFIKNLEAFYRAVDNNPQGFGTDDQEAKVFPVIHELNIKAKWGRDEFGNERLMFYTEVQPDQLPDTGKKVKEPWEMTREEFLQEKDIEVALPNKKDTPTETKYKIGDRYIEFGNDPYVFEYREIDPNTVDYSEKWQDEEGVINRDDTQQYIKWFKEGKIPMPITVVFNKPDNKLKSTNRRRILAARTAGVKTIPAWVEIGKHSDLIQQAISEGKTISSEVKAEYPELFEEKPISEDKKEEKYDWDIEFTEGKNKGQKLSELPIESVDMYEDNVSSANFKDGGIFQGMLVKNLTGALSITKNPVKIAIILDSKMSDNAGKLARIQRIANNSETVVVENPSKTRDDRQFPFMFVPKSQAENYTIPEIFKTPIQDRKFYLKQEIAQLLINDGTFEKQIKEGRDVAEVIKHIEDAGLSVPKSISDQLPDTGKKVKEPWEMTREEYLSAIEAAVRKSHSDNPKSQVLNLKQDLQMKINAAKVNHAYYVKQAISENKPIPSNVKAEYPELFEEKQEAKTAKDEYESFDTRGYSFAITVGDNIVTSGANPSLAKEPIPIKYWLDLAAKYNGKLFIAPTNIQKDEAISNEQLIMGRTWEQIRSMQQGTNIIDAVKTKMPNGAIEYKQYSVVEEKPISEDKKEETPIWEKTFQEYLNENVYEGITDEEKRYLLDTYISEVESAIASGKPVSDKIERRLPNLKRNVKEKNKVEDDILRVDDRAIVKGKNGNPDFEGSFRGWSGDKAIVWIESIGSQWAVDREDVSKKKTVTQPEVQSPEKGEEQKPEEKIEDFGEKIEGAKKMTYQRLKEVTTDDILSQPLSKVFPRPDFVQLVKDGTLSEDAAILLKFLYDNIPPKPRKKYRLAGWAKQVRESINFFTDFIENKDNAAKLTEKLQLTEKVIGSKFELFKEVQKALGFPAEDINMGAYEIKKFHRGEQAEKALGITYSIVKSPYIISDHKTAQEAADALKKMLAANKEKSKDVKLSVYQDRKTGKYFIGKKTATGVFRLVDNIETVQEARAKIKDEMPQLQELWNTVSAKPEERRKTNRKRVGTDYRKGKDITPNQFTETFGFRGTQFGNWVKNDERQESLNDAYDALMDLSTALKVSPRALSLGGELGMAFGARGSGKYSAHYESGQVVINLTKTRGAGSLAHEWWHSLDNYFSRQKGSKDGFLTESPGQGIKIVDRKVVPDEKLRNELIDAFKGVINAIKKSDLGNRSYTLDGTRSQLYWSTMIEMSARSFENFIIEKLGATNEQNDYLANFKETGEWINSGVDINSYPYPLKDESPAINEAFQQLFDTIEERVEGENTIMFRFSDTFYSPTEKALTKIQQNKGTVEQFKAMLLKNGAKQAELDWMNWDERFPDSKKSITKEEVQGWIEENKVEVEEVVKGDYSKDIQNLFDELSRKNKYRDFDDWDVKDQNLWMKKRGLPKDVKYSQYQLPGGKNYKEVLLTMPNKGRSEKKGDAERLEILRNKRDELLSRGESIRDVDSQIQILSTRFSEGAGFRSSHFDEPNILSHIRFNERTDSEGNKVLFIEEIQSDWAQKGKKEGFKGQDKYSDSNTDFKEHDFGGYELKDKNGKNISGGRMYDIDFPKGTSLEEIKATALKQANKNADRSAIPDMPFKQTPQWVNLALRRMIRYAAENGFDKIAWTTGEQQAERYKEALTKEIKSITPSTKDLEKPNSIKGLLLFVRSKGGDIYFEVDSDAKITYQDNVPDAMGNFVGKDLSEVIGKDAAEQAMEATKAFETKDMVVRSAGMKTFYDAIVPNAAKELGKKFGANVEPVNIQTKDGNNSGRYIHPTITANGYAMVRDTHNDMQEVYSPTNVPSERDSWLNEMKNNNQDRMDIMSTVLSMPITDSMRESALNEGFPLFKVGATFEVSDKAQPDVKDRKNALNALEALVKQFGVPITVIHSSELSNVVGLAAKRKRGTPVAFYHNGTAYIISDKIQSVSDTKESYLHEAILHKGLDLLFNAGPVTVLGTKYNTKNELLDEVYSRLSPELITEIANQYTDGANSTPKQQREIAEEALAKLNELDITPSRLEVFMDSLWKFIKKLVGFSSKQFTRVELQKMLSDHRKMVQKIARGGISVSSDQKLNSAVDFFARLKDIAQTETAAFKKWFGNSKVVDEKGNPLVVYHGTQNDFDAFDGGAFFTDDYMNADGYASGENVIEAFIKIERPLIINARGRKWDNIGSKFGNTTIDIVGNLDTEKYDGVIFNNVKDSWIDDIDYQESGTIYYVVNPTQIKSATGNRGTFDENDPNINFRFRSSNPAVNKYIDEFEAKKNQTPPTEPKQSGTSKSNETEKTIVTERTYKGDFSEAIRKKLEEIGLTRKVQTQKEAEQIGLEIIDEVGLEKALEAVRLGEVQGAPAGAIFHEKLKSIDSKMNAETDPVKYDRLAKQYADITEEMGSIATLYGQYNAFFNYIYQTSDLGFNAEKMIRDYKEVNNGEISPELEAKFKQLEKDFREVQNKLAQEEQKVKELEEQASVDAIKASIVRQNKKKAKASEKIREKTDKLIELIDLGKLNRPGIFTAASPGSLAWDLGLETVKTAVKATGRTIEAIAKGWEAIKSTDWYKNLDANKQKQAKNAYYDFFTKDDEKKESDEKESPTYTLTKNGLKIPHSVIRDLVEQGIDNINDLTQAVYDIIVEDLPDITEREVRDAITGYGNTMNQNQEEIEREIRKMKDLGRSISGLEDIAEGERPKKSGLQRDKPDPEQRAIHKQVREAMKLLPIDEQRRLDQQKTQLDTAKQRLINQIEDLQREIDRGELTPKNARSMQEDDELRQLRAARDAKKKEHEALFNDEDFLNKKRVELSKKAVNRRIAELEKRIADGDFAPKVRKELIADNELIRLRADKLRIQEEYKKEMYKAKLRNRTQAEKVKDGLWDAWGVTRALRATGEFSFVGIQGLINTIAHPVQAKQAFKTSMRFLTSQRKADDWMNTLKSQDWYPVLKESKLAITEPNAELTAREELFYSGWTDMIWTSVGKMIGKNPDTWINANPLRAVERAAVGYLDTQRVLRFLDGVEMLQAKGLEFNQANKEAYKEMADVINTFTGRASIGRLDPELLTKIFFSPRNWASVIKTATPYAFYHFGKKRAGAEAWKPSVAQKMALADFSKFVGLTASLVALAALALNGDDDDENKVELDPRSTDFGKIKIGDVRIDPWGGRIQQIVLISRLISGEVKNSYGEVLPVGTPYKSPTSAELILQMATNKLAPSASILYKHLSAKVDPEGNKVDTFGEPYSLPGTIKENLYPIYWETLSELAKDDITVLDGLLAAYAFFGGGVNMYDNSPEKVTDRKLKEQTIIKAQFAEDLAEGYELTESDKAHYNKSLVASRLKQQYVILNTRATRAEKAGNIAGAEALRKLVEDSKVKMSETDFSIQAMSPEVSRLADVIKPE